MKNLFLTVFAVIVGLGLGVADAEAKRIGGGNSIGMQRSTTTNTPATPPTAAAAAPSAAAGAAAQPRRNSWLGPVAGLAAGLGLAALASHLGFGEEFGNVMLIALVVIAAIMLFRMLARRRAPANGGLNYAGAGPAGPVPDVGMARTGVPEAAFGGAGGVAGPAAGGASQFPAGFDADGFARQAKVNFLRLQAANDAGNLNDLREFTTPEMFAELQMEIRERRGASQNTEVMDLHATVLACVEESGKYIVSVRFHGLLREEAGAPPVDFDEVWHLVKSVQGNQGWVVAGVQQTT